MTEDSNKPKLCKNCKWCRPWFLGRIMSLGIINGLDFAKCARPKNVDLVTGKQQDFYCSTERSTFMDCGKDGK